MTHKMGVIIQKKKTHHDLVRYLHAACFSPVLSTWKKAIKNNNFTTWPGLTVDLISKHLPPSLATVRGHIHRERRNLQSTKKPNIKMKQETANKSIHHHDDNFLPSPSPNKKTNTVAYIVINQDEINTAYQDLTG